MNPTQDVLPLTGIPWLDALVKIAGAVGIVGSVLANVLPKGWALTQALARAFLDGRKIQAQQGAQEATRTTILPPIPTPPNLGGPE